MQQLISISVDLNNADSEGRIRLITTGALNDIITKGIELKPGLEVLLDDKEEFKVQGKIEFSTDENIWVVRPDWSTVQEFS